MLFQAPAFLMHTISGDSGLAAYFLNVAEDFMGSSQSCEFYNIVPFYN